METQDIILIISAVTISASTIIGAIFAGWIALRQLPTQARKTEEVHTLVNRNFSEQKTKIDQLEAIIKSLQEAAISKSDEALGKSEARER